MEAIAYLAPYEFSATILVATLAAAGLFARGQWAARRAAEPVGFWRGLSFWLGLALTYAVLQTHLDYLAQHMFWVHRAQHLVLHHLGPILMVLAVPHAIMGRALPAGLREGWLRPLWRHPLVRGLYRFLQHPLVASVLFAGIIYFWLIPSVHFAAMLSADYYDLMNGSVLAEGLLFWWLILDPRSPTHGGQAPRSGDSPHFCEPEWEAPQGAGPQAGRGSRQGPATPRRLPFRLARREVLRRPGATLPLLDVGATTPSSARLAPNRRRSLRNTVSPRTGGLGFGVRMIMLWGVMPPQILLGAYIGLNNEVLFEVYNICGRAWPVPPLVDQQIGGLLTWIPASMMSVITALIVLRWWLRDSDRGPAAQTEAG